MNITVKLPEFDGSDNYPVSQWVRHVEETADDGWPSGLLLLKARRSLTGLAASWLRAEDRHKTWKEFKTALIDEFTEEEGYKAKIEEMSKVYMEAMNGNCAQIDYHPPQRLQRFPCEEPENVMISSSLSNVHYQEEDETQVHQIDDVYHSVKAKQTCFATTNKDGADVEDEKRLTVKDDNSMTCETQCHSNDDIVISVNRNVDKEEYRSNVGDDSVQSQEHEAVQIKIMSSTVKKPSENAPTSQKVRSYQEVDSVIGRKIGCNFIPRAEYLNDVKMNCANTRGETRMWSYKLKGEDAMIKYLFGEINMCKFNFKDKLMKNFKTRKKEELKLFL